MKVVLRYFADQRVVIFSYVGIIVLFSFTFFLYEIPLAAYLDAILFSLFFFSILLFINFIIYVQKHHERQEGIRAPKLYVRRKRNRLTLVEEEYEELLKILEKEYAGDLEKLEEANSELLNYYSMWSHQIKTPLAVLNLKMQENELDQTILKQELLKIDQYLEMMLQYLRINHSENDFVFQEVELFSLMKRLVKKYATFFIHKNLTVSLEEKEKIVISDQKWVQFVIEQVLFNALKYTKNGGIYIYINPEDSEELVIEDTGIGILPEDIFRVFEKGYTGFNGRVNQKASGLGLFMSKMIMNQLGHEIRLTSEIDSGTKVFLAFRWKNYRLE